jgi:hypothetical protein
VGWNLARELIGKDHEVTVVESDRRRYLTVEQELEHAVQYGDATELWVLERAGIQRADLVVAVTGDDEDNLLICQVAKEKYLCDRIIARVNNPRNLQTFKLLGIQPAVSATDLILRLIEHEVPAYGLVHLLDLPEERLEIIELVVSHEAPAAGREVPGPEHAGGVPRHLRAARRRLRAEAGHRRRGRATRCSSCSTPASRTRSPPSSWATPSNGVSDRHVDVLIVGAGAAGSRAPPRWPRPPLRRARSCSWGASRPALRAAACLQGLPPGRDRARRHVHPPRVAVGRAGRRAAHAHERDEARPGRADGQLSSKEKSGFGQAVLATGANVRRLRVPGAELEGIHYLRTLGNATRSAGTRGRRSTSCWSAAPTSPARWRRR